MTIQEFIPLAPLTTLKIGGAARYLVEVNSLTTLQEALAFAATKKLPHFILGGGSNVLISDLGYPGVVLRMSVPGIEWREDGEHILATVGSGVSWDAFVEAAVRNLAWGVENLSGIPGTVGASPIQNIGAYGKEASHIVEWVEVYDTEIGSVRVLPNAECAFSYRDSIFKHREGKGFIVTRVGFRLTKRETPDLKYKDVAEYFGKRSAPPSLEEIRQAILEIRAKKFPELKTHGTAGSFFKNPILSAKEAEQFLGNYPDAPHYALSDGRVKFPTGWILDHVLHLRGMRKGEIGSWDTQALVLVNYGSATAKELKAFAREIQYQVATKTNILLEPEVVFVE